MYWKRPEPRMPGSTLRDWRDVHARLRVCFICASERRHTMYHGTLAEAGRACAVARESRSDTAMDTCALRAQSIDSSGVVT